jgi:hypothetical protein
MSPSNCPLSSHALLLSTGDQDATFSAEINQHQNKIKWTLKQQNFRNELE